METRTVMYGKNGVPFTLIQVVRTPLESILAIGDREKSRKVIEESQKRKLTFSEQCKIAEMVEKLKQDFNLSKEKFNDTTNRRRV